MVDARGFTKWFIIRALCGVTFDTLDTDWHLDHTTPVAVGTTDLYSVAMHEMLHALGFGTSSLAYFDLLSGEEWLGQYARELNGGSGLGLVDDGHLEAVLSRRLVDGELQIPNMAAILPTGSRYELTAMDLAILRDMGFQVVPEPSTWVLNMLGVLFMLGIVKRQQNRSSR